MNHVLKPVAIKATDTRAELFIDGVEVGGCVTGYKLEHKAGELPRLTVEILSRAFNATASSAAVSLIRDVGNAESEGAQTGIDAVAIDSSLVVGVCVNEVGMVEMTMMLINQPGVTYTLSKLQAQLVADALTRACQGSS